jgi:HrpA-like RNA helicase
MDDREMDHEECKEKFINRTALLKVIEVRNQLARSLRKYGRVQAMGVEGEERSRAIRKCVTSGFFMNVAKLANDGNYYTVRGKHLVMVSTSSMLHSHGDASEYIVFGETHDGRRGGIEIRSCSTIDARWLRELAPHYWV